jgi:hypothetical protein
MTMYGGRKPSMDEQENGYWTEDKEPLWLYDPEVEKRERELERLERVKERIRRQEHDRAADALGVDRYPRPPAKKPWL